MFVIDNYLIFRIEFKTSMQFENFAVSAEINPSGAACSIPGELC